MLQISAKNQYTITLDDDPMMYRIIQEYLGVKSIPFTTVGELMAKVTDYKPLAVFVDIHLGLEEVSGLQIIPVLKKHYPYCPLLVITSDPRAEAVREALACGADDFIRKPISQEELCARVQARLEDVAEKNKHSVIRFGDLLLDTQYRCLSGHRKKSYLSATTTHLLACLMRANGTVVSRAALKRQGWGKLQVTDNALDRQLHLARAAISDITENVVLKSVYGKGFLMTASASSHGREEE